MTTSVLPVVRTGWGRAAGAPATVLTEHAVDPSASDPHRALCGASAPVVDRRRPWSGRAGDCCPDCLAALTTRAA